MGFHIPGLCSGLSFSFAYSCSPFKTQLWHHCLGSSLYLLSNQVTCFSSECTCGNSYNSEWCSSYFSLGIIKDGGELPVLVCFVFVCFCLSNFCLSFKVKLRCLPQWEAFPKPLAPPFSVFSQHLCHSALCHCVGCRFLSSTRQLRQCWSVNDSQPSVPTTVVGDSWFTSLVSSDLPDTLDANCFLSKRAHH